LSDCLTFGGKNAENHKGGGRTGDPTALSAEDDALRFARTSYDDLAGRLGVAIADTLGRKNTSF